MGSIKEVDDRFKKFGTVSFTGISKTNDFVDYLEKGKVMGTRCKDCGLVFFPPRADCHQCLAGNIRSIVHATINGQYHRDIDKILKWYEQDRIRMVSAGFHETAIDRHMKTIKLSIKTK